MDRLLDGSLALLEIRYDFKNKTFGNLPQRIHHLANTCDSIRKHNHSEKEIGIQGIESLAITHLPNFDSVKNIIAILVPSLLAQLAIKNNIQEILEIWRTNSSELSIKKNMFNALDLIESMLLKERNKALTVLKTQEAKSEKRLVAALQVVQNKETEPSDLFYAHTFITTSLINQTWLDPVVADLAELLSTQWLKKTSEIPIRTVSQVEHACKSSETGKKKIGHILLAAHQAVPINAAPDILQQFHSWTESESTQ